MPEQLRLLDDAPEGGWDPRRHALTVRESRRARHLILQAIPPHGFEIVVPRGTRLKEVQAFVDENRQWIERAHVEIAARFRGDRSERPTRIEFAAVDREFDVGYRHRPGRPAHCRGDAGRLTIVSPDPAFTDVGPSLRQWLLRQAALHLKPWLWREAERVGRRPNRVEVRLQRTRWGSCSSRRNISLNASLMFLEPALVRYLLIHELCHLYSLNHSARYWRIVERFEPDYRRLDSRLSDAWVDLPWWAIQARSRALPSAE